MYIYASFGFCRAENSVLESFFFKKVIVINNEMEKSIKFLMPCRVMTLKTQLNLHPLFLGALILVNAVISCFIDSILTVVQYLENMQ